MYVVTRSSELTLWNIKRKTVCGSTGMKVNEINYDEDKQTVTPAYHIQRTKYPDVCFVFC